MAEKTFEQRFIELKTELKAPKSQYNKFGKYKYRSLDDITQSLKPLEKEHGIAITMTDDLVLIGDRYYIKATAKAFDSKSDKFVESNGYARESLSKKGMDDSQITGATSTYARKYAISGLLGLDDGIDADAQDNSEQQKEMSKEPQPKMDAKNYATINGYPKDWINKAIENSKLENVNSYDDINIMTNEQAKEIITRLRRYKELYEQQKQEQESVNIEDL